MHWLRRCLKSQEALIPIRNLPKDNVFDTKNAIHSVSPNYNLCSHPLPLDYATQLEACIQSKSLSQGKIIHQHIIETNTHVKDFTILHKLVRFYVTCNQTELAHQVFDQIPNPSVFLWNTMIRAYAWNGPFQHAIDLYHQMLQLGVKPNNFTFPFVLKACSAMQEIQVGIELHEHAKKLCLDMDIYVSTALVDMYAKCGDLIEAQTVFNSMSYRDIAAWNAMITGLSLHALHDETMQLLVQMQQAGIAPNSSTFASVLATVGQANKLSRGKAMHGYSVRKIFSDDVVVANCLLDMYAKCHQIVYARKIFNMINQKNERCWSAMIGGYVICDSTRDALALYDEMVCICKLNPTPFTLASILRVCAVLIDLNKGKNLHCYMIKSGMDLDTTANNSVISMYAKCGIMEDAVGYFDEMISKNTVSYNAIISGYVQNGYADKALLIFRQMQLSGTNPDVLTMIGLLPACSHLAAIRHGACCHGYSVVRGFTTETKICNAISDMYSKCGKIHISKDIFDRMHKRDIVSWNTMIIGYDIHGLSIEALSLFHELQASGLKPDDVTFIAVLSACSHSGLVTEGKHWFNAMNQDFNIKPTTAHYICMVDLLARAGNLDEAYNFIQRMPFEPDVRVWGTLLVAQQILEPYKNFKVTRQAQGLVGLRSVG